MSCDEERISIGKIGYVQHQPIEDSRIVETGNEDDIDIVATKSKECLP